MRTLILTDNLQALSLANELRDIHGEIDIYQSPGGTLEAIDPLDLKQQASELATDYGLIISIHCKQFFPPDLVKRVRCINVHPGFNPYNRGWYPQVFSIINGLKAGATIHEMDEKLDHGAIIAQKEYRLKPWDTSASAYGEILKIERELLLEHFASLRRGDYQSYPAGEEGNINRRKDFDDLREIELDETGTFGDFINRLRALTHGHYKNAYFRDEHGRKIYVRIELEPEP
jgi:dTDP-4-amino-4,6-dideoxyglucose formyltransferase